MLRTGMLLLHNSKILAIYVWLGAQMPVCNEFRQCDEELTVGVHGRVVKPTTAGMSLLLPESACK